MLKYKIEKKIMKLEEEKKEVAAKLKPEQKGSFSKFFQLYQVIYSLIWS